MAKKKSFNEEGVEIWFDEIFHTYHHEGKKLVSATQYIKKFYKEFDNENVSRASAKSWGVSQQDVKDLWLSNGELASLFGKAVHLSLEHYDRFKRVGKAIQDKKDMGNNYAMPKHPILKSIVEQFIAVDNAEGDVIPEALLSNTELGYCGHADRIVVKDWDKKICRIGDYKVNIGSEEVSSNAKALPPFNNLPANKITKYQLQMSFYANLLEKSGWTVEGLDVFILEDGWRHYELSVLKVI